MTTTYHQAMGYCAPKCEPATFPTCIKSKSYVQHWSYLTIIYILTLILVILILWNFFGIQKGTKEGDSCDTDHECEAGTFCSGSQTCQKGDHGLGEGAFCSSTDECDINHQCVSGTCQLKTTS